MAEINQMRMVYSSAVKNIGIAAAAHEDNHGKELTGEGIERVRKNMLDGNEGPTDFQAARGATTAAAALLF